MLIYRHGDRNRCVDADSSLASSAGHQQLGTDATDDAARDLVLDSEDIFKLPVVVFSPEMTAGFGFEQRRRHPDAVAGFAHTAFEHVADPKLASDPAHIDRTRFIGEHRVAGRTGTASR